MSVDVKKFVAQFEKDFGHGVDVLARAPGRVNLIGEHTDYNDGFVLPSTVDFDVLVAVSARTDRKVIMRSPDYNQKAEVDLDALNPAMEPHWAKYIAGVADVLQKAGHALSGINLSVKGDVPRGSGLSSSAALEMATVTAFCELEGLTIDPVERVRLAQKAENDFVGVPCGIMDQFISGCGDAESALFLDCRSYDYELIPLRLDGAKVVICDTQKKRTLAASAYAERTKQCAAGATRLSELLGRDIPKLRDVSAEEFAGVENHIDEPVRSRCRHVIGENQRVLDAVAALRDDDLEGFGRLMAASHASLRDDYEVSCQELDTICEIGAKTEGELGSRMTGAGFGGCTVHLIRDAAVDAFRENVARDYYEPKGLTPSVYVCVPTGGAGRIEL